MNRILLLRVLVSLFLICSQSEAKSRSYNLPSYFPHCYRNDPKISECLIDATEKVRPFLVKGVPELKIPPFEPFMIPQIVLQQGTSALNFKAVLTNVIIHGLTEYKFTKFDFDVPNLQFFCDTHIPGLRLEGDYTVTGRILIAPIQGKGKFTAKIDSCEATVYQKVKEIDIDGVPYVRSIITNSSIQVSGPKAHLDGLFDGNQELNDATNKAINDNVDELFEDLKPVVEQTLTSILEDLLFKAIMTNVPFNNLYPIK